MYKLILMAGIPGSGKSTYCQKLIKEKENYVAISRDIIRFQLLEPGDSYFSKEKEVYKNFVSVIKQELLAGKTVIADQTSLTAAARQKLVDALDLKDQLEVTVIYIKASLEDALHYNSLREGLKRVPPEIIKDMSESFEEPTAAEQYINKYIVVKNENKIFTIVKEKNFGKNKIWFTSDLHFNHDKPFIYKDRGYSSIEEHNEALIKNWNEKIKNSDEVYLLGDVCMGEDIEANIKLLKRLKGNIHLITGNHDTDKRIENFKKNHIFTEIIPVGTMFKYRKWIFILSHYPMIVSNYDDKFKKIWNLCGHTHTTAKFEERIFNSYNVGVDAHNNFPIEIEEIIADLKSL